MPIVFQALAQTVGNSNEQDMRLHSTGQSWTKSTQRKYFHTGIRAMQKTNAQNLEDVTVPGGRRRH